MIKFDESNSIPIRGLDIVPLLEKSTHDQLFTNIEQAFPLTKKRQHATGDVTITNLQILPYVGMKMIHVFADVSSISGKHYKVGIQFLQVEFVDSQAAGITRFVGRDGEQYFIHPIALDRKNIKITCQCMDFRWRFAMWNSADKSLIGAPPPPYVKKTNRPPVNPDQVPGICKHALKVIMRLSDLKIVN